VIAEAARGGTWQAAAWWLERRRSERWARREPVSPEEQARRADARLRAASDEELVAAVAKDPRVIALVRSALNAESRNGGTPP
jgi:hypothetical protein